jgi:hypothetical protein
MDLKNFIESGKFATDKTTRHRYEEMYWAELSKIVTRLRGAPRIMEIGLGCFMPNGPGGSAKMWRSLFPMSSIHIFEYLEICGREWEEQNPGVAVVHYGDQSKAIDLIHATEGEQSFDLIVDDGSHVGSHQYISLLTLWKKLSFGGSYIVEDIHGNCMNWAVPGTPFVTGGTDGNCLVDSNGKPTFFARILTEFLPVLVRSADEYPQQLPFLESINFHHEAVIFTKRIMKK